MANKILLSSTTKDVSRIFEPLKDLIPEDRYDEFIERIHSAIQIYLDLDKQTLVSRELKDIERISRKPNYTLINVLENASDTTWHLLKGETPLQPLPDRDDQAGIDQLAKEIRQRIIVRMKPLSDRMGYRVIGGSKSGRPLKRRLTALVSFTAAAYVSATGKSYRRMWDGDSDLPFHLILEKLFYALDIEASVDEAIRRQQNSQN